jgi:hypothetical protein
VSALTTNAAEVLALLDEQGKFQAIKRVRELTGLTLKEAKDLVDRVPNVGTFADLGRRFDILVSLLHPHFPSRSQEIWNIMIAIETLDIESDTRLAQAFRLLADVWAEAKAGGQ